MIPQGIHSFFTKSNRCGQRLSADKHTNRTVKRDLDKQEGMLAMLLDSLCQHTWLWCCFLPPWVEPILFLPPRVMLIVWQDLCHLTVNEALRSKKKIKPAPVKSILHLSQVCPACQSGRHAWSNPQMAPLGEGTSNPQRKSKCRGCSHQYRL